jgi:hypothetical protein
MSSLVAAQQFSIKAEPTVQLPTNCVLGCFSNKINKNCADSLFFSGLMTAKEVDPLPVLRMVCNSYSVSHCGRVCFLVRLVNLNLILGARLVDHPFLTIKRFTFHLRSEFQLGRSKSTFGKTRLIFLIKRVREIWLWLVF